MTLPIPQIASLSLADVLRAAKLSPTQVLLLRHPWSNAGVRAAVLAEDLLAYTADQDPGFPRQYRYWLNFLGEEGNTARFLGCYENLGGGEEGKFELAETPILADLAWRLVVDWGAGTRTWKQSGLNADKKPLLAIIDRKVEHFPGFENIVLTFAQLEEVVAEPRRYAEWHAALSAVNAVYLIVDIQTGKQYVGSAYGDGGLLGRWQVYVDSFHGYNLRMIAELQTAPAMYQRFQFSVLQILPRSVTPDEIIRVETLYKRKLLTQEFGLNAN
jgi:hypothetical protein